VIHNYNHRDNASGNNRTCPRDGNDSDGADVPATSDHDGISMPTSSDAVIYSYVSNDDISSNNRM
jgi:hypothetical protein